MKLRYIITDTAVLVSLICDKDKTCKAIKTALK